MLLLLLLLLLLVAGNIMVVPLLDIRIAARQSYLPLIRRN